MCPPSPPEADAWVRIPLVWRTREKPFLTLRHDGSLGLTLFARGKKKVGPARSFYLSPAEFAETMATLTAARFHVPPEGPTCGYPGRAEATLRNSDGGEPPSPKARPDCLRPSGRHLCCRPDRPADRRTSDRPDRRHPVDRPDRRLRPACRLRCHDSTFQISFWGRDLSLRARSARVVQRHDLLGRGTASDRFCLAGLRSRSCSTLS